MVFTEVCGHHVSKASAVCGTKTGQFLWDAIDARISFDSCASAAMYCRKQGFRSGQDLTSFSQKPVGLGNAQAKTTHVKGGRNGASQD